MKRETFQLSYMFIFMFCLLGIAGNIELGVKTPLAAIIVTIITGALTAAKMIYWGLEAAK